MAKVKWLTPFIFLILFGQTGLSQNIKQAIDGVYRLPNGLDVQLFKNSEGNYSGKIVALNNYEYGEWQDVNNPEKEKRKDSLVGKVIITGLTFVAAKSRYSDGIMYGPEKGLFFNLQINKSNAEGIEVVGSKFLFSRTMLWKRIE